MEFLIAQVPDVGVMWLVLVKACDCDSLLFLYRHREYQKQECRQQVDPYIHF